MRDNDAKKLTEQDILVRRSARKILNILTLPRQDRIVSCLKMFTLTLKSLPKTELGLTSALPLYDLGREKKGNNNTIVPAPLGIEPNTLENDSLANIKVCMDRKKVLNIDCRLVGMMI